MTTATPATLERDEFEGATEFSDSHAADDSQPLPTDAAAQEHHNPATAASEMPPADTSPSRAAEPAALDECRRKIRPTLLSLARIADRLALDSRFGAQAPAHITLKRWSSNGVLDRARRPDPASPIRRSLYDLDIVVEIVLERMSGRFGSAGDDEADKIALSAALYRPDTSAVAFSGPSEGSTSQAASPPDTRATDEALAKEIASLREENALLGQQLQAALASQAILFEKFSLSLEQRLAGIESTVKSAAEVQRAVDNLEATRRSLMLRYDSEIISLRQRLQDAEARIRAQESLEHEIALMRRAIGQLVERSQSVLGAEQHTDNTASARHGRS